MLGFQTNGNWFALLNFLLRNAVLAFGAGIGLLLEYVWILQIGFSLIRWNQLTGEVIARGFYKCIKIYCFFLKHFITLLNVPLSFLCHRWQSAGLNLSPCSFSWPQPCWGAVCVHMHLFISVSPCPCCRSVQFTCGLRKNRARKLWKGVLKRLLKVAQDPGANEQSFKTRC